MKKLIVFLCAAVLSVSLIMSCVCAEGAPADSARYDMSLEAYETWAENAFEKVNDWREGSKNLTGFPLQMEAVIRMLDEFKNNSSVLEKGEYYISWHSEALKVAFDERMIGITLSVEFGSEDNRLDIDVLKSVDWHNGELWFDLPDGYSFEDISGIRINYYTDCWPEGLGHAWFKVAYDISDGAVISRTLETEMDDGRFIVNWYLARDEEDDHLGGLEGLFYDLAYDREFTESFNAETGEYYEP